MTTRELTLRDGTLLATKHWEPASPRARVIFVHGLGDHVGRWDEVARFFVEHGYEAHTYDLRGHGESGGRRLDVDPFDLHIDDLAEMIEHIHRRDLPLVIYGHSMGGLIATGYAQSNHPQPDLYVLSAPALGADIPLPLRWTVRIMAKLFPTLRVGSSIKGEHLSKRPEVGDAYFADPLVEVKGTARSGNAFLGAMDTISAKLHHITTPALVVHGGDDSLVPTAESAPLAALPGVQRKVFPTLRHEIHNEAERDEVLEFVAGWLDANLPR